MSMASLSNTTVTLLRASVTLDAMGGETRDYATAGTAQARILADKATEHDQLGRRAETGRVQILSATDLGARLGDVIQDAAGNKYQVANTVDMGACGRVFSIYATLIFPVS